MSRRLAYWLLPTAALLLTACPAFFIDRGQLAEPSHGLTRPAVAELPAASQYVELQDRWRRQAEIGVSGAVVGTLQDPSLVAAGVAHSAALQSLDRASTENLLITTWESAFGPAQDRWPIDLDWRFDEQFISNASILEAENWSFKLYVDEHFEYAPIAVSTLAHGKAPVDHFWEGKVRLWFPWDDVQKDRLLLAGRTRVIRLRMGYNSGVGDLTWRFRTAY